MSKDPLRTLIAAAALLAASPCDAGRMSNSFLTVEGEGVSIADDGSVCVDAGATGPITVAARPGWLVNGRESLTISQSEGEDLQVTSKLGEDEEHVHKFTRTEDELEHLEDIVLGAEAKPVSQVAMYALPETSVAVTASATKQVVKKGKHRTRIRWTPCKCGAIHDPPEEFGTKEVVPDHYEWESAAAGKTFLSERWSGPMSKGLNQEIRFTVTGKRDVCALCTCTNSVVASADVHELSIERPDYLGLDRTDAGLSGRTVANATARIDPKPASATYRWTNCGKCQFVGAKNSADVTYGITNSAPASTKFLAEGLTVTAKARNSAGRSASATCTTNFTVVAVDVTIGSVGEDKEETEGAFVQYVKDANGSIWAKDGTNALLATTITCSPELLMNEKITITAPTKSLYLFYNGKYNAFPEEYSFTARLLKDVKFVLHGHDESMALTDHVITIAHDNSSAKDKAKYASGRIRVTNIKFNHDTSASAKDAINIRRSYKEPIDVSNGEWIDTGTRVTNEPFCYTTNHSVTIKARLEASGFITSAVVRASCSGAKGSLSNVLETNVVFVGGVSSPEYVTFTLKDKTLSKIDCSRGGVFRWSASKVNGIAGSSCMMNETGPHTVYTIFNEPKPPWNNAYGSQQNAWTNALEFAIVKTGAQGASDDKAALSAITRYLHGGHGMRYDTTNGAPRFIDGPEGGMMKLTNYIKDTQYRTTSIVNCYDQAGAVVSLGSLCGIDVEYVFMQPFGYINEVDLVGVGKCNNPFFEDNNPRHAPIIQNPVVGGDIVRSLGRTGFGNHAFAMLAHDVFDACAGPVCGISLRQYTNTVIDTSTPQEANFASGGCIYRAGGTSFVVGVTDIK